MTSFFRLAPTGSRGPSRSMPTRLRWTFVAKTVVGLLGSRVTSLVFTTVVPLTTFLSSQSVAIIIVLRLEVDEPVEGLGPGKTT